MEKQKILLVDDNAKLLKLGAAIFESGGYEVITATDGVEALAVLSDHRTIDLVVTDILMPNMDGYTLCCSIRKGEANKDIPIIIYSATYISKSDEQLALEIGADVFIRKPASLSFLLSAAKDLISRPKKQYREVNKQHELTEVTRQYNARLIEKLEQNNEELEKTQLELIKSEQYFRALVGNANDLITLTDEKGKLTYVSPALEQLTGCKAEKVTGMSLFSFQHPDDVAESKRKFSELLLEPGKPTPRNSRFKCRDGHYIRMEGTVTNLLHDKNVQGIVGNFRDVTARVIADEALKQSKGQLQKIMDNSLDVICTIDGEGKFATVSKACKKIWGYEPRELAGKMYIDMVLEEDRAATNQSALNIMAGEDAVAFENRYICKNGSQVSIMWSATWNAEEQIMFCIAHDMTEKKKSEKRLEMEQERYTDLFLQAPSRICILKGPDHIYEMANPPYLALAGKTNIIGKSVRELFPELKDQGVFELLDSVYKTGMPFHGEEILIQIDRDGKLTDNYLDFAYLPYKNSDGEVEGVFSFANDVTMQVLSRKKIEQNENRYRALVENGSDAVVILSAGGKPIYVSPSIEKVLGYTEKQAMRLDMFSIIHPDDVVEVQKTMAKVLANPGVPIKGHTGRMLHESGYWHWYEATLTNMLDDPAIGGIVDNFRDVTDRIISERKIIHANRMYAFISQINQAIVHSSDDQSVYKEACRIAIEVGKFKLAWIGLFDEDHKTISIAQGCGIVPEDDNLFKNAPVNKNGPQDQALSTGIFYVCNNIEKDLDTSAGWKLFALKYGIKSCMVLAIKRSGMIIGTLNLYSCETNFFDEQEILLLKETAGDISFALDVFEKERHRKEMEKKVLHSEIQLKNGQAIAHFGSWELDFASGIAEWSEEACRIYGLSTEDNLQTFEDWISFIHPDDLENVMNETKKAREMLCFSAFDHRIVWKDGTIREIHSQSEFRFDIAGHPIGIHGVAHDITEEKKAKAALTQSEANLRLIMDLIPQSIFAKDYDGKYVFVNKSFATLFGLTPDELLERSVNNALPVRSEADYILKQDQEVISSGENKSIPEHTFTDYKGNLRLFHTEKVPFTVAGTNTKAMLGIAIDITAQKLEDAERKKMIADIVQRNKDLEQFSQIVSHNLRAPVANILGIVDVMQTIGIDKEEEEKTLNYLGEATKSLDNVIRDINKILEIKHDITGKKEMVKFEKLLNEIKLSIVYLTEKEEVQISGDFSAIDGISTFKSYLYSIFSNLISNSIKYHRQGIAPVIEITSALINNKVQLNFKDNGLGIDLEKRGHEVFGLYKRFHHHIVGKGIGLYMVKTQVEALGGTIAIASEPDKGTEFKIEFDLN